MQRRVVLGALGAGALSAGGAALFGVGSMAPTPVRAQDADATAGSALIPDMAVGAEDAPVEMIEYGSFTCPHCATFHEDVYPQLVANYIDPGLLRFVYREVYFDRPGLWASMVARCAGPERFFGVTDILFENQRTWTQGDPATVAESLRAIGRSVGLSEAELETCLTDGAFAQSLVERYEAFMEEHPIQGTPAFVIAGELHGNMSYSAMSALIDDALAAAQG
ncbi:MAG: DsbA family protein [Pseudomonadota bacterium]